MRNQKTETERLTGDRENFRSLPKNRSGIAEACGDFGQSCWHFAAAQLTFLTACSVNIPMVSDSAATEGYTDAQTMLIIATERNRYRQVYTDQIWNVEVSDDKTPFQTYLLEQIRAF